jgi:nucleotidyltransferase/DNA polymerase involved in DNA repair
MRSLGILTGADLKERSLEYLVQSFGKAGNYYYNIARARDERAVEANRIRALDNNLNAGNPRNGFVSQINWCGTLGSSFKRVNPANGLPRKFIC